MALGALTLPTIQSSFASGSSAMLPTISNMASVQKMSALDSMQEVFFDIREGIVNLSKVFAEKISGLNTHLAFRLDKLNNTMSKIASVAVKDLSLEEEKQDEIDVINRNANIQASETVDDIGDVGQGTTMLDSLKRFFEKFKSDGGESSILKLALMAGALFLLSKFLFTVTSSYNTAISLYILFLNISLIYTFNSLIGKSISSSNMSYISFCNSFLYLYLNVYLFLFFIVVSGSKSISANLLCISVLMFLYSNLSLLSFNFFVIC